MTMTRHSEATITREQCPWASRRCSVDEASDTKIAYPGEDLETASHGQGRWAEWASQGEESRCHLTSPIPQTHPQATHWLSKPIVLATLKHETSAKTRSDACEEASKGKEETKVSNAPKAEPSRVSDMAEDRLGRHSIGQVKPLRKGQTRPAVSPEKTSWLQAWFVWLTRVLPGAPVGSGPGQLGASPFVTFAGAGDQNNQASRRPSWDKARIVSRSNFRA